MPTPEPPDSPATLPVDQPGDAPVDEPADERADRPDPERRSARTAVPIALRWADMDAYRHVNNVQMLRLLEQARVVAIGEWFGTSGGLLNGVVVARQEIEYLAQLDYRAEPVVVDCWVCDLGGSSFTVAYEVRDAADATRAADAADTTEPAAGAPNRGAARVYARAESTLVAFDFESGRSRRLDDAERRSLESRLDDPPPLRRPDRGRGR